MSPYGDVCGLSSCNYFERYGDAELSLILMATGTTRSLYILTARETATGRRLFDMRIEATLDGLILRARRANRLADDELRAVAMSYARYLVDTGAYRSAPKYMLVLHDEGEALEALSRK